MLNSTKFVAALAGLSLAVVPTAALAKKSSESLPETAPGIAKKIDPKELEKLVAFCALPGQRLGHYISNGQGHPNEKGRGHACDHDSPG
jgi:hypothetical protein